ncbi:MAG: endonuclease/exonuclease/phosphatase family protein [Anaerolineae bacterium]
MENERGPRTIRLLTLNLRQGGRSRIEGVVRTVLGHRPDIAVLTEYRATPGPALGAQLAAGGLVHQASSEPERPKNGVFVAARLPFRVFPDARHPSPSPRHWLQVRFAHFDLGAIYNGLWGEGNAAFAQWLEGVMLRNRRRSFILAGDLNWLEVGDGGNESPGWVEWLRDLGYSDAWRRLNPSGREYSWTNHNGTRTRVDYVFLSRRIAPYLTDARYDHDRQNGNVSDHDPLIVEMMAPAPSLMHRVLRRLGSRNQTVSTGLAHQTSNSFDGSVSGLARTP